MGFTRILRRVFGCWGKRKSLKDKLHSPDHNVAANVTLSESDSRSVCSVYLSDSPSAVSEDSQLIAFDDSWSYTESVELVRYYLYTFVYSPINKLLLSLRAHSPSLFFRF